MPSPLTHAIVGAATARTLPDSLPRWRIAAALALVAMLPDLDLLAYFAGIPFHHPFAHRGLTHSLPVAAAAGLLAMVLVRWCFRQAPPIESRRIGMAVGLALASHGLLDAVTNGGAGVGLLMPFVDARLASPIRPVAVSPLGLDAFVARAAWVFASEALWIWFPTALLVLADAQRRGPKTAPSMDV